MSTELSTRPKGLDRCADQIRMAQHKAQRSFAEYIETVGGELEKAQRLLADHHAGFGQWVRDEFGWSTSQADQLIKAKRTMSLLSATAETKNLPLPATESQCRPLASLPAEDVPVVWEQICAASEQTGKPITAAVVKAVVDELSPDEKPSAKPRKPAANKGRRDQRPDGEDGAIEPADTGRRHKRFSKTQTGEAAEALSKAGRWKIRVHHVAGNEVIVRHEIRNKELHIFVDKEHSWFADCEPLRRRGRVESVICHEIARAASSDDYKKLPLLAMIQKAGDMNDDPVAIYMTAVASQARGFASA